MQHCGCVCMSVSAVSAAATAALGCTACTQQCGITIQVTISSLCRHIKFHPPTQPMKHRYPYLILQTQPKVVKIAVHMLVAWLSQGPPPNQDHKQYTKAWLPKKKPKNTIKVVRPRVVVCHNDVPSRHQNSKLQFTQVVETNRAAQPKPSICLSKFCVNPKCLVYDRQANNSRTGSHHRVLADKHNKAFAGQSCKPDCAKCNRAATAS